MSAPSPGSGPVPAARPGRRVLLVRMGALGDVVNSTVLLRNLRRAWPDAYIGWAVHPAGAAVLEGNPDLDALIVIDRRDIPLGAGRIRRQLAPHRFDLAIDLQKLLKSALVCLLSGAPERLGFDTGRAKELSWLLHNRRIPPADPARHVLEQVLEFAHHLGVPDPRIEWSLPVHDADRRLARELLADMTGPMALVCVGASEEIKRWSGPSFARVADALWKDFGHVPVLLSGPDPAERELAREVVEKSEAPVLDAGGRGGFRQLFGLMERASLFIGGDTGPLHLAAAMGVPTVGLYGAQSPTRSGPWGYRDRVVFKGLACAPCLKSTCRLGTTACMREITPADVLEQVEALLRETGSPPATAPSQDPTGSPRSCR